MVQNHDLEQWRRSLDVDTHYRRADDPKKIAPPKRSLSAFQVALRARYYLTPATGAWDEMPFVWVAHNEIRSHDVESTPDDPTSSTFLGPVVRQNHSANTDS